MRFLLSVILIAALAATGEWFLPWWTFAVAAFVVSIFTRMRAGIAFLSGFIAVGGLWLGIMLWRDAANQHILSARMAALLRAASYSEIIIITALLGGLIGGLAAMSGALVSGKSKWA